MPWRKAKPTPRTVLSPHLEKLWGFVPIRYLILASEEFLVFVDDELAVDWKTTSQWDKDNAYDKEKHAAVINRAAALESADWDNSDEERTLKLRRQIGEAIARCLECNYASAELMLVEAEKYRVGELNGFRRKQAIQDFVKTRDEWRKLGKRWSFFHYALGIVAILFSTVVASKLPLSSLMESLFAWLVALFTALLTFLTPDKKADKYLQAWSILSTQIAKYNSDQSLTLADVLDAYHQGEAIIFGRSLTERRKKQRQTTRP
jgi:hypothetical protein